ncbi:MAG: hypothetical protein B6242_10690 [Anaerolineaceae bacterium 4572_78]|nr:MAG: hypothetical protein B6242_10690 [Anaerolineaceae bacterium 4572_78]
MLDVEQVIHEETYLFQKLSNQWQNATGGELALLAINGSVICCQNGLQKTVSKIICKSPQGDIKITDEANAIIAPVNVQGQTRAYLVSHKTSSEKQPLLTWFADTFAVHVTSKEALQGMTNELIAAWNQLDLVYRITQTLGDESDLSKAMTSILEQITTALKVEAGFILIDNENAVNSVVIGPNDLVDYIDKDSLLQNVIRAKEQILTNDRESVLGIWPDAPPTLHNFIGMSMPTEQTSAAVGLINSYNKRFTAADSKLVIAVSEQLGAIIDNFSLHHKLIVQERVRRELEIAAEIQESLLPKDTPKIHGLNIAVNILPAHEVGGDFYDFVSRNNEYLTVLVGDVVGKGIPAAMFTSMIRTMFRVENQYSHEPHLMIERVNEALHKELGQAELFVTVFVAIFDIERSGLMFANAGHVPGLIYHTKSKKFRDLKATSFPIGITGFKEKTRPTQYVHLTDGDVLILYSDGISETINTAGEFFGFDRIRELVKEHPNQSANELKELILDDLANFRQGGIRTDDVTLVVVRFSHDNNSSSTEGHVIETIDFEYTADNANSMKVCQLVADACRKLTGLPEGITGDQYVYYVELAVSELFTNAVEHAYNGKSGGTIQGRITLVDTGIQVDLYDHGMSFNPDDVPPPITDPSALQTGGFGLFLVRQIMDVAEYTANTPEGNRWRVIKYLPSVENIM